MEREQMIDVLARLGDGVDPVTGEFFPDDSPYQQPRVIRALHGAIDELAKPKKQSARVEDPVLDEEARALYEELRLWRYGLAKSEDIPPYIVATNRALTHVAHDHPTNREQLAACVGVGPATLEKYGDSMLTVMAGLEN